MFKQHVYIFQGNQITNDLHIVVAALFWDIGKYVNLDEEFCVTVSILNLPEVEIYTLYITLYPHSLFPK